MNKRHYTDKKGITLIALIITIVVLLILAGTAISLSLNSTDLFLKSDIKRVLIRGL